MERKAEVPHVGVNTRSVPDYTPALSTKDSFSFSAKHLREILIP
jgi:hypothetical protein